MTKKTFRSPISEEFVSLISQHPPQWRIETPTEIAKRAVKDGIHANEALQKISGRWGASDTTLALTLFIESLCNKNSALILEYTIFPVLLTTRTGNPNTVRRLSVISADKSFADALRILFENGGPSMLESVASLPAASSYGSIVCVPPMGHRPPGNKKEADGFGGETVIELARHLQKDGLLFWITGRGVLYNPRAKQTLADLKTLGLNLVGCVETSSVSEYVGRGCRSYLPVRDIGKAFRGSPAR